MLTRLIALGPLLLALTTFSSGAFDDRKSEAASGEAAARSTAIFAEIEELGSHDWAGHYTAGDGMGVNTRLTLAPHAGYLFEWHGCLGLYDRNYGSVTAHDRRLQLAFTFENVRKGFRGIAPEFIVVPWGARRYLVPADDIVGFCNAVNQGSEPRAHWGGMYLLRRGDEAVPAGGTPEIPAAYRDHLLASPVQAAVIAIGEPTRRPGLADIVFEDTPLTLNEGRARGLRVGMELFVVEPDDFVQRMRITEIADTSAEAVMTRINDMGPPPELGWRVSTRPRWRPLTR